MFTVVLFLTNYRTWKQPKSINRGMDKADAVHIYNGVLLSKRSEICRDMDGLRRQNKSHIGTHILIYGI